MKQRFASLGRLTIISSVVFSIATVSNFFNYYKYWKGTIFAVQTVDFNILSYTLPTKLSIVLKQGITGEIQRTLNSNYGLFGIVVTDCKTVEVDCPSQRILYSSKSSSRWKQQLQVNNLPNHPYDMLRNPPPVYAEGHFNNIYLQKRQPTGQTNFGAIIGRVYYVRGVPPTFINDYTRWIQSPLVFTGVRPIYTLTVALYMLVGFACWLALEQVLRQKKAQQKLAQQEQKQLLEKQEHLLQQAQDRQQQLQEKSQQIQLLLKQKEQVRAELERDREEQQQHTHQLEQRIARYETQLVEQEEQQSDKARILKLLQQELTDFQDREVAAVSEIQQREQAIATLRHQIDTQEQQKQQKVELLEGMRQDLQHTKARESEAQYQVETLNQAITTLTLERDKSRQRFDELEQMVKVRNVDELAKALKEAREATEFATLVMEENTQLSREKDQLRQNLDDAQLQIWELEDQVEYYTEYLTNPPTDQFREEVVTAETVLEVTDLSKLRLALVSGHHATRREVIRELSETYRLQNYVEIPASSEAYLSRSSVKNKISNCDLIAVIIRYTGHDSTQIVSDLRKNSALTDQVLWLKGKGKTGIVREIISYAKLKSL